MPMISDFIVLKCYYLDIISIDVFDLYLNLVSENTNSNDVMLQISFCFHMYGKVHSLVKQFPFVSCGHINEND
jgi:hypothetical protein